MCEAYTRKKGQNAPLSVTRKASSFACLAYLPSASGQLGTAGGDCDEDWIGGRIGLGSDCTLMPFLASSCQRE